MTEPVLDFTLPFRPASLKNSPRIGQRFAKGGRRVASVRPSVKADQHRARIRAALQAELGLQVRSLLGDRNVAVSLEHLVELDHVRVRVWDAGPKPPKKVRSGRRQDLHNMLELVLDAMQPHDVFGGVYDDDRQVVEISMRRVIGANDGRVT